MVAKTGRERRVAPRLQPALGTVCTIAPDSDTPATALVWNISRSGMSLLTGTPPAAGVPTAGELKSDLNASVLPVMFRVVHVNGVPTGDSLVGCQFLRELTDVELAFFAAPPMV